MIQSDPTMPYLSTNSKIQKSAMDQKVTSRNFRPRMNRPPALTNRWNRFEVHDNIKSNLEVNSKLRIS